MDNLINKIVNTLGTDYVLNQQGILVWLYFKGKPVERFDLNYLKELELRGELTDHLKNIDLKIRQLQ